MKKANIIKRILASILLCAMLFSTLSGFTYASTTASTQSLESLLSNVDSPDVSPNPIPGAKKKEDAGEAKKTPSKTTSTDPVGQALPTYDIAVRSGKTFPMQVTAPAGADVTGTVAGKTYELKPSKSGAKDSTYIAHKREFTLPSVSGTEDLGPVVYQISYKGKTYSKSSEGSLFAVAEDSNLKVQIKNNSAMVFNNNSTTKTSGYRTVARQGAIDTVVDFYGDLYKLGTGGWITAQNVTPLTSNPTVNNTVSRTTLTRYEGREVLRLEGTTHPIFTASHTKDVLTLTFFRTSGISPIDVSGSNIFSDMTVTQGENSSTITLTPKSAGALWGYAVEYSGGNTEIVFTPRPRLSADESKPLKGITIALDPGHGGNDNGTSGVSANGSWVEKDANLAIAQETRALLEEKGATVVMVRNSDSKIELSERMDHAQKQRVDLFVSLHCNSAPNKKATGVEVYYHHPTSKQLASTMLSEFSSATDRKARGTIQSHYIVTLGSYAPSILLEMGFMSNASEYKDICSNSGVKNAATGVYNGIVAALS